MRSSIFSGKLLALLVLVLLTLTARLHAKAPTRPASAVAAPAESRVALEADAV